MFHNKLINSPARQKFRIDHNNCNILLVDIKKIYSKTISDQNNHDQSVEPGDNTGI